MLCGSLDMKASATSCESRIFPPGRSFLQFYRLFPPGCLSRFMPSWSSFRRQVGALVIRVHVHTHVRAAVCGFFTTTGLCMCCGAYKRVTISVSRACVYTYVCVNVRVRAFVLLSLLHRISSYSVMRCACIMGSF